MRQSIAALQDLVETPSLLALVLVRGISSVGDWLYLAALPILIYQATRDVALVGVLAAGRLLPWLILSMPAGIVVDLVPTRALLLVTETLRAALMLLIAVLVLIHAPLASALVATIAAACASTFAMPAFGRLVPEIARDTEQLGRANVVASAFDSLACIFGPAIAAVLIASSSLGLAFLVNGLSFAAIVVVLVRIAPHGGATKRHQIATASLARPPALWSRLARAILRPLSIDAAVSFAAGFLMVMPVLAVASLGGADDVLAGLLSLAGGVGGIAGAGAAAAFVNGRFRAGMSIAVAIATFGSFTIAGGSSAAIVAIGVGVLGAAVVALDTLNMTHVQRAVDAAMLGRALGLIHTSAAVWVILGSLVPSVLVDALGFPAVALGAGLLIFALGGLGLVPTPNLRWQRRAVPSSALI
jgi:hypothetical protein